MDVKYTEIEEPISTFVDLSSHRHEEKSSFSSRCTLEDTLLQAGSSNRANGRSTSNNKRVKLGFTTSNVKTVRYLDENLTCAYLEK